MFPASAAVPFSSVDGGFYLAGKPERRARRPAIPACRSIIQHRERRAHPAELGV